MPRNIPTPPRRILLALAVLPALLGARTDAQPRPVLYEVDADRSHIHVVTGQAGVLGFLGHEHAILATDWSATICYAADAPGSSRAAFTVATPSLVIDSDRALAVAGLSSRPDADTVDDLQRRMLGPEFLAAREFPEIRFETRAVAEHDGGLAVSGPFTLHGRTHPLGMDVEMSRPSDEVVRFQARATTAMTRYGIEPESTLGIVDVADEFDIVVDLFARATDRACP